MGIIARPTDYEKLQSMLANPPVILNDLDVSYIEDAKRRDNLLLTEYTENTFSLEPMCDCRYLRGGDKRGRICPKCKTEVVPHTERKIQSELFIRCPEHVTALINPLVFAILSDVYKVKGADVIRYLVDRGYKCNEDHQVIVALKEVGIGRGVNCFVNNFDKIMDLLINGRLYPKSEYRSEMASFIEIVRPHLFPQYLPVPNKICFVTERSPTGRYAEMKSISTVFDAANIITSLKTRLGGATPQVCENAAAKVIINLADFYRNQLKTSQSGKTGWWRKHIFGTRMPFTGRAVITSLTEVHDYDELHLPWGLAVVMMRFHIENKLYKRGYTPNQAKAFISKSVRIYSDEMREIFDELIRESPYTTQLSGKRGIPILLNRNPSLLYGSIQQFFVTVIKSDVEDLSTSFSILTTGPMNADFDGDELSQMLICDYYQYKSFKRMGTFASALKYDSPREMSGTIKIAKQLAMCIGNWISKAPRTRPEGV